MHSIKFALAALALASLACATVAVTIDAAPDANFSAYSTYFSLPSTATVSGESADALRISEQVQAAIDGALKEKGYRAGNAADADLAVGFMLDSEETRRRVNAADPDTDFYVDKRFIMNTLSISIADSASGKTIWQGTGEVEIRAGGALVNDDRESALIRATREVLAELPAVAR